MKRTFTLIVSILTLLSLLAPCFTALADGDFDDDRELFAEAEKILMGSKWERVGYGDGSLKYSTPETYEYKRNLGVIYSGANPYYGDPFKYWSLLTVSNGALHLTVFNESSAYTLNEGLYTYNVFFEWVNGTPQYMVWTLGSSTTVVYKRAV